MEFTYGIELEGLVSNDLYRELEDELDSYGELVGDASLRRSDYDSHPFEFRSSVMTPNNYKATIEDVCGIMAKHGVTGNKTCGFHLHLGSREFEKSLYIKRLVALWLSIEDVILATQPPSRRKNQYCQRLLGEYFNGTFESLPRKKDDVVRTISSKSHMSRYGALNVLSLSQHNTIECRLHAYTTDSEKILNWIELMTSVFKWASKSYDSTTVKRLFETVISKEKVNDVFNILGTRKDVARFYKQRISYQAYAPLVDFQKRAVKARPMLAKKARILKRFERARVESIQVDGEIRRLRDARNPIEESSEQSTRARIGELPSF